LDYQRETQRNVAAHGRPIAFYSGKPAIFGVSNTAAEGGDGMSQFGRALHELNIDILCANSAAQRGGWSAPCHAAGSDGQGDAAGRDCDR
jgi:hypothetical protein